MGMDVYLRTIDGQEYPGWDNTRYTADREMWTVVTEIEHDTWTPPGFPWEDDLFLLRPTDMDAFRASAASCSNPERWLGVADILEKDPKWWLYASI